MQVEILSGIDLKNMLDSALSNLSQKYRQIDMLNVFPVPDGDTGINMYLTLSSAVKEVSALNDNPSAGAVSEAAARGALMGARGNSGVILSQLLRGMARGLKEMERVSGRVFAESLDEGVKVAFKSVIKPVEGTILTVAREAAKEALKESKKNISLIQLLTAICSTAESVLAKTPNMLPALKEAGVVDAGGMGWLVILQGFRDSLIRGEDNDLVSDSETKDTVIFSPEIIPGKEKSSCELPKLTNPYCTELLIKHSDVIDYNGLKGKLEKLGDSLVLVDDEQLTKVHIHSAHPGRVLELCQKYGEITDIKINNMNEQMEEKPYGILAVGAGQGIIKIMENLGADKVVVGGQTMNPSTGDLLQAIDQINTRNVIVLPNNSNIIMTANQLVSLTTKQISVIPARSIPQGIAALLANPGGDDVDNTIQLMSQSTQNVKTGEVTYAVRDTKINGTDLKKGDIIGIFEDDIVGSGSDVTCVSVALIEKMIGQGDEICTLYYGDMVCQEEAQKLTSLLEEKHPDLDFELHFGGQPLYYYIISVE